MAQNHSGESRNAEMTSLKQTKAASLLSLFTSSGTLVCCALPALLVGIGAGAAMSSLISNVPQLVWFSEHKVGVFAFAALMLLLSGAMHWRARSLPCPVDPAQAATCIATRRTSFRVYVFSLLIFLMGGFFAFIAPLIL
ncbi:MAG TPA: hypothetical protein VK967_00035 [Methylotenera sp.]|nr:hypothetical protein [Methylotenera sp.]